MSCSDQATIDFFEITNNECRTFEFNILKESLYSEKSLQSISISPMTGKLNSQGSKVFK